jgi:hypothetical protein
MPWTSLKREITKLAGKRSLQQLTGNVLTGISTGTEYV